MTEKTARTARRARPPDALHRAATATGGWAIQTPVCGPPGTTGATGAAGATGATGAAGAAGRNGTDGKDGKDGKDGVGIREVSLNDSGELIVTLTDGTETNLGKITGEDGAPGVGISSVQVGENGMLTVTLSNGESVEAGAVFSAQEGKTVRTVSYITAAAAALAFLWLAVLTTLFAKSRRTAVHR